MRKSTTGRRLSLLTMIVLALLAGLILGFIVWLLVGWAAHGRWAWDTPHELAGGASPRMEVLRTTLTVLAGIGGVVALVVAYRWQEIRERQEPREQYVAAVNLLGGEDQTTRLAGVYAVANLADEHPQLRQQCVDVLCAELRRPWKPVGQVDDADTASPTDPAEAVSSSHAVDEQVLRDTILRVLAQHLRPTGWDPNPVTPTGEMQRSPRIDQKARIEGGLWSDCDIDLTGAALPGIFWNQVVIRGRFRTDKATFHGPADFVAARFEGHVAINHCAFRERARFVRAHFSGQAYFTRTRFLSHAYFSEAMFGGQTDFASAVFSIEIASFSKVIFKRDVFFIGADLTKGISLERASFYEGAFFGDLDCRGPFKLTNAQFVTKPEFTAALLNGPVLLDGLRIDKSPHETEHLRDLATELKRGHFEPPPGQATWVGDQTMLANADLRKAILWLNPSEENRDEGAVEEDRPEGF